jgi:hypothetical protein
MKSRVPIIMPVAVSVMSPAIVASTRRAMPKSVR